MSDARASRWSGLLGAVLVCAACGESGDGGSAPADEQDETGGTTGAAAATTSDNVGSESTETTSNATVGSSTTDTDSSTGGGAAFVAGEDALIPVVEGAHIFWLGWDEGQNQREMDLQVSLPEPGFTYESVTLTLRLGCPEGACDWWDRKGSLGLVEDPDAEEPTVWELARFVTPYRVGGTWSLDVTALQTLLAGEQTLRLYIDTWVGPGHANGNGWIVDAQLEYVGGVPDLVPTAVVPLWPRRELTVGDPMNPLGEQLDAAALEVPMDAAKVEMWTVISGHGQGNLNNCAEFCQLAQGFLVGAGAVRRTIWRDDCDQNPIQGQQGTWTLPRAGWCPGDIVQPWVEDITEHAAPGSSVSVTYDIEEYENTCRPDAPMCMGCALGTGCDYDGGNHTAPTIQVSSAAVVYTEAG
ncbi:MAG: peptide-N-glycosidase F-related protein [Myxococcota bacterium]